MRDANDSAWGADIDWRNGTIEFPDDDLRKMFSCLDDVHASQSLCDTTLDAVLASYERPALRDVIGRFCKRLFGFTVPVSLGVGSWFVPVTTIAYADESDTYSVSFNLWDRVVDQSHVGSGSEAHMMFGMPSDEAFDHMGDVIGDRDMTVREDRHLPFGVRDARPRAISHMHDGAKPAGEKPDVDVPPPPDGIRKEPLSDPALGNDA